MSSLVELLAGGPEARESAYAKLEAIGEADEVPTSEVLDALVGIISQETVRENRRACAVMLGLMQHRKHGYPFCTEFFRASHFRRAWQSPAILSVVSKAVAKLTYEDVLICGSDCVISHSWLAKGFAGLCAAGGVGDMEMVGNMMEMHPLMPFNGPPAPELVDTSTRLTEMATEMVSDPGVHELSDLEVAGVWCSMFWLSAQRPSVGAVACNGGIFPAGVAELRKHSPADWIKWNNVAGLLASGVFMAFFHATCTNPPGVDPIKLMDQSGAAECACNLFKAFELHGASSVGEANVNAVTHALFMLHEINLTAPEAKHIMALLSSMPSALRFVLKHDLKHIPSVGCTTSGIAAGIVALVFGKYESGDGFEFSQSLIDDSLMLCQTTFDGGLAPFFEFRGFHMKSALHLCISDANKALLVRSEALIPLLLSTMLLDSDSVRQSSSEAVKGAVQNDSAECMLQLSLFEQGRELLAGNSAVMEVLHALHEGGRALTPAAKSAAEGALLAIEGRAHHPEPQQVGANAENSQPTHVMISYQWDVQVMIKRLVDSLQSREYEIWFDLDRMKGSTMDAMADAVDEAAVVVFAVSLQYKESSNCRLEANYAYQQKVPMIPIMVQKDYRAKGWLGLLLGTKFWHSFFFEEYHSWGDAAWEQRVDDVAREIGDRGKRRPKFAAASSVQEGIPPPAHLPPVAAASLDQGSTRVEQPVARSAAAPAPAPVSAMVTPPRAAASASLDLMASATTATQQEESFTPSMMISRTPVTPAAGQHSADSTALVAALLSEREAMAAEIKLLNTPREAVSATQLVMLETRLEALHAAQLLTDAELEALENIVGDAIEATAGCEVVTMEIVHASAAIGQVHKLIVLSEKMPNKDSMFARQARRKFTQDV